MKEAQQQTENDGSNRKSVGGRPPLDRSINGVPIYLRMESEAVELLGLLAASPKKRGAFVSRLIYEHLARVEERERLKAKKKTKSL